MIEFTTTEVCASSFQIQVTANTVSNDDPLYDWREECRVRLEAGELWHLKKPEREAAIERSRAVLEEHLDKEQLKDLKLHRYIDVPLSHRTPLARNWFVRLGVDGTARLLDKGKNPRDGLCIHLPDTTSYDKMLAIMLLAVNNPKRLQRYPHTG